MYYLLLTRKRKGYTLEPEPIMASTLSMRNSTNERVRKVKAKYSEQAASRRDIEEASGEKVNTEEK